MLEALRQHRLLVVLSLAYTAAFAAYGFATGNPQAPVYLVVLTVGLLLVAKIHSRTPLSRGVLWGLTVWGLLHMAGGLIEIDGSVLYGKRLTPSVRFDQAVHAFGFGTLAAWQALRPKLAPGYRMSVGLAVIVALAGMGVGAVNEVVEFAATLLLPETNVGGYRNTGWDLVANTIGSIAATVWVVFTTRNRAEGG